MRIRDPVAKPDLGTGGDSLFEEIGLKAAILAAAARQIIQRPVTVDGVGYAPGIEGDAVIDRMTVEAAFDAGGLQLVEHILIVAPVFQTLKITVEPASDRFVPFVQNDPPAGACQNDGTSKTGGTCASNGYRLVLQSALAVSAGFLPHLNTHSVMKRSYKLHCWCPPPGKLVQTPIGQQADSA